MVPRSITIHCLRCSSRPRDPHCPDAGIRPSVLAAAVTVLGIAWLLSESGQTFAADANRGRVIYNLDCTQFFMGSFGSIAPETIDKFVATHASLGVTDLFVNVNAKRTNYRSDVWESYWDGYDPNASDDQPFFAGLDPKRRFETAKFIDMWSLHEKGCDYGKRMLAAARRNHVKGWISLRMNDDHNPGRPEHPAHSTFWRSHPEWRLSYGLNYERPEVREHYVKLIREVCSRYDLDGLELDFQRFWLYFPTGREHEGTKLMMGFMEQARAATREAAKRLKHPVELAVRVPSTPWIARRHGLDAVAWGKAGLVDLIVAASFWFSSDTDIPIETWKGLLIGQDVRVALGLGDAHNSGASGRRTMTHEEMRGAFVSGLYRGADAVYFFNLFTGPRENWPREDHDRLLTDVGSYAALQAAPRRHASTMTHPWAAGEPGEDRSLPYTGTHGVFRLHIGPKPAPEQRTQVELVVPDHDEPLDVSVNAAACPWSGLVEPEHIKASGWQADEPRRHAYDVPAAALSDGYNLIEVRAEKPVKITWVEISVQ